jgi:hypothetical protein
LPGGLCHQPALNSFGAVAWVKTTAPKGITTDPRRNPWYSFSCRACPHPGARPWPWPQLRSCRRQPWWCRSTWSRSSGRPWWRCLTTPYRVHRRGPAWSMPWSWFLLLGQQQRAPQGRQLQVLGRLVPPLELVRRRQLRTKSSHPCDLGTPRSCSRRSSRSHRCKVR